jgi:outer membrane lipoprotein-sorting protein
MRSLILALATILLSAPGQADDVQAYLDTFGIDRNASFSGTRRMETKEGQMEMFVRQAPDKMRMESNYGGQSTVIITREDKGVSYMLMPSMSMYREMDTKGAQEAGASDMDFSEASEVGREEVNGYDCTKYRARFEDKQGGKGGGYYWVSDDGILMKVDMIYQSPKQKGQRMVLEMLDVEIGPQDPAEFEVPANYSQLGFAGMMGQMGGGNADQELEAEVEQDEAYEEAGLAEDVGDAVQDETERNVIQQARKSVRKRLGKLFGN